MKTTALYVSLVSLDMLVNKKLTNPNMRRPIEAFCEEDVRHVVTRLTQQWRQAGFDMLVDNKLMNPNMRRVIAAFCQDDGEARANMVTASGEFDGVKHKEADTAVAALGQGNGGGMWQRGNCVRRDLTR